MPSCRPGAEGVILWDDGRARVHTLRSRPRPTRCGAAMVGSGAALSIGSDLRPARRAPATVRFAISQRP